jgi:hypothetical protein
MADVPIERSTSMMIRIWALSTALVFSLAGTAVAQSSRTPALTPGGLTIAGPGSVSISSGQFVILVDGVNSDACVTVSNTSRSESISIQMVGDGSDSRTASAGQTVALCLDETDTVQLGCEGNRACQAIWRLDKN